MKDRAVERSAACSTCGKTFARSDTLLRHEKSHLATEDRGPLHRVTVSGTFRACHACAQARSRCSGGTPCGRCKIRSLDCSYPNKRRKITNPAIQAIDVDEKPTIQHQYSEDLSQHQPVQHPQAPGAFQELIYSHAVESSYPGSGQLEFSLSKQPSENVLSQGEKSSPNDNRLVDTSDYDASLHSSTINLQQPHDQTRMDASMMPEMSDDINTYSNQIAQQEYRSTYTGPQTDFGYDDPYNATMDLNWIPLSVYPSPYGDMDQDFSFLLPTLSETASFSGAFNHMSFDTGMGGMANDHALEHSLPKSVSDQLAPTSMHGYVQSPASSTSDGIAAIRSAFGDSLSVESKKKRRKSSHNQDVFTRPRRPQKSFDFPDTSDLQLQEIRSTRPLCTQAQYSAIRSAFERLCLHTQIQTPFLSSTFPDRTVLGICVDLYFEHFHSTFPLLHTSAIGDQTHWLLLLVTAAIGSNFAPTATGLDLREALQELSRRAVDQVCNFETDSFHNPHVAQARILNLVCVSQSDRAQIRSMAPKYHAELSRWCLESGILQLVTAEDEINSQMTYEQKMAAWTKWITQESLRRTGYFIWFLDCAFGYMCNSRPLCNMDDARAPLPCPEALWNATSVEQWFDSKLVTPTMPSLCAALEDMYNHKKANPRLSEISNILLVHALYSRTWEVGTHIKQPLSEWKPTGDSRGFLNTPSKDNFWLPLYPLYANWRNSACDCLDVLHWHASGVVARAIGVEHHGVLHLHLSRIILLTPFQEIQDLLFFLINHNVGDNSKATFYVHDGSYQGRSLAKLAQIRKITSRWLREDQHKARLAVIHAGSVFWHVRRYSSNNFFEPLAVYLASIVLWTYGSYKSAALGREAADLNGGQKRYASSCRQSPDINVQPTRVELAAKTYSSLRSKSSTQSPNDSRQSGHHSSPGGSVATPSNHRQQQLQQQQQQQRNSIPTSMPSSVTTRSPLETNNNNNNNNHHHYHHNHKDSDQTDNNPPSPSPSSTSSSSSTTSDHPEFIHLDRPCDDEIVQHFVRNGHNMSGYMSNVGDICQTPQKVLVEGAKILRSRLGSWGSSREYHDVLVRLVDLKKGK